jgi:hypothetical protein
MIFAVRCECPNGHVQAWRPFEGLADPLPPPSQCEEWIAQLLIHVNLLIEERRAPARCPVCGLSRLQWHSSVYRTRLSSLAVAHAYAELSLAEWIAGEAVSDLQRRRSKATCN